jgi:hypothetical protein
MMPVDLQGKPLGGGGASLLAIMIEDGQKSPDKVIERSVPHEHNGTRNRWGNAELTSASA